MEKSGAVGPVEAKGSKHLPLVNWLVLVVALLGVGISWYLAQHKLNLKHDPTFVSECSINEAIDCDRVNTSEWSELLGLPISLYGVPLYGVIVWLALSSLSLLRKREDNYLAYTQKRTEFIFGASLVAVLVSVALGLYSAILLKTFCLYCVGLYAVSIGLLVLSVVGLQKRFTASLAGMLDSIVSLQYVFVASVIVVMLWSAGALGWFQVAQTKMVTVAKQHVQEQFEEFKPEELVFHYDRVDGQAPGTGAAQQAADGTAPGTQAASLAGGQTSKALAPTSAGSAAPTPVGAQAPASAIPVGVPGGKLSEDGYQFFVTPIDDQDFIFGNVNATVTVVKYADFECAFCKFFAQNMKGIMQKYGDRVRFVMKQYPMNPQCNPYMAGYDKHPNACNASRAAICAGRQGKFWEMHDALYESAPNLSPEANRKTAGIVGLDLEAYDKCLTDPSTDARIRAEIELARRAAISGTPRTYVGGRLLTGSNSADALEYYIQKALESPHLFAGGSPAGAPQPAAQVQRPAPKGAMIEIVKQSGKFYIDPYECAITKDGKAVSIQGVMPAMVSFEQASAACSAAGKRPCTEEEWVSACAGQPALDDNGNGWFNDDAIEGNMYPYGAFYTPGTCHDSADKGKAFPIKTGEMAGCTTPTGLFDMAGNVSEWVQTRSGKPGLMGGPASGGSGNTCNRRTSTFGSGYRNQTTGFRCCSDAPVESLPVTAEQLTESELTRVGAPLPPFDVEVEGKPLSISGLSGKVVLVTFFASWCGPCKKEFPVLVELYEKYNKSGLEIIAIGVDAHAKLSLDFAAQFNPTFNIVTDEKSELMGLYGVYSMPATFIADKSGIIRYKSDEFAFEVQLPKMREAVEQLIK